VGMVLIDSAPPHERTIVYLTQSWNDVMTICTKKAILSNGHLNEGKGVEALTPSPRGFAMRRCTRRVRQRREDCNLNFSIYNASYYYNVLARRRKWDRSGDGHGHGHAHNRHRCIRRPSMRKGDYSLGLGHQACDD